MLTPEMNERLTRVGLGTPAGDLLRRYWYPIAFAADLTDEQPTRMIRLLGEDLVLFKDRSGCVGLLADHCSHRGASMLYGRVEERGIACAYHGWLYDTEGNCLECPAEPEGSRFYLTVKHRAYPVQQLIGLYWAYLGPEPAPRIPPYDLFLRQDGRRTIQLRGRLDCNWLQAMENSVDSPHSQILHQDTARSRVRPTSTTRGQIDSVASYEYSLFPYGVMKNRTYKDGRIDEHPLIFPNILQQGNGMEIRVPLDDTHTWVWEMRFQLSPDASPAEEAEPEIVPTEPFKDPEGVLHPHARYFMNSVEAQDYMAWETQGALANRPGEHLATSDRGVVMYRELLAENVDRVARGEDPMGVIRDPEHPMIDTHLMRSIHHRAGLIDRPAAIA